MALPIQFDFFEDDSELTLVNKKVDALDTKLENVRRGIFARHHKHETAFSEMLNMIIKLQEQVSQMNRIIIEIRNK